ncbi:MFS transporter [Risungbinella massiliensis]|uniref:MFS transporter n=1 Tax=Risungbinella massiliensis TaxID=1329796 RepID=UPI0011CBADFF|nr:MFS transporter [Risungbinella massiliensis]
MSRSFHLLWVSQTLANLADSLYIVSVVTMIYQITESACLWTLCPCTMLDS